MTIRCLGSGAHAGGAPRVRESGMSTTYDRQADGHVNHHPGFVTRWFGSTNHKDIGTLYLIFSVSAGIVGGLLSIVMRAQLMHPGSHVVATGQEWNTIVTAHGLVMIFFTLMPALMGGFANWFVPLLIGAPDMERDEPV